MSSLQCARYLKHLQYGRACLESEKYGEALANFVFLANVNPTCKNQFESDFVTAMCKWLEVLQSHGEVDKMMTCFQQAVELFPNNEILLNNVGASLLNLGLTDEAASMFRRSAKINPLNSTSKEGLESVASALVERWHFRMLNDKERNQAYKSAITHAVLQGCDSVLDIGSGTGILSMFAVQAGAKHVYACEMSKTMCELSQDVLRANKMEESVKLIHKKSTGLIIGEDLPSRVSLVVTETLDCGLLGEGILKTITHAWESLLKPCDPRDRLYSNNATFSDQPNVAIEHTKASTSSQIIPSGAILYAQAIDSKDVRHQSRCGTIVSGFSTGMLEIIGGEKLDDDSAMASAQSVEPYTTECLNSLQHGYKPLTDVFSVTEYNFYEPHSLTAERVVRFSIPVTHSGCLDAIAVWFDLHLDSETCISTSPGGGSLCWEQAVFPVFCHHLPKMVKDVENERIISIDVGDCLVIEGTLSQECVTLKCTDIIKSSEDSMPAPHVLTQDLDNITFADKYITVVPPPSASEDSMPTPHVLTQDLDNITFADKDISVVPPPYMLRANDNPYNSAWKNSLDQAVRGILRSGNNCRAIGLSQGSLHLAALSAAHTGASEVLLPHADKSSCPTEHMRGVNNIPGIISYGSATLEEAAVKGLKWDLLFSDMVEPSGVLQQQLVEDVVFARGCLLRQEVGVVMPRTIQAYSMCIDSQALVNICKVVSDENTLGLKIATFINVFSVSTHVNVDLTSLPFTPLCEEFELFTLDFMKRCKTDQEMLGMLETTAQHRVKIVRHGTIHALPYWFNMDLDGSHTLSTYNGHGPGSHWRQAVVVLAEPIKVQTGEEITVSVNLKGSCITLDVKL